MCVCACVCVCVCASRIIDIAWEVKDSVGGHSGLKEKYQKFFVVVMHQYTLSNATSIFFVT